MTPRFYPETIKMKWWESILELVFEGRWIRSYVMYSAVLPGQKGYEEAPYGIEVIQSRNNWKITVPKQ